MNVCVVVFAVSVVFVVLNQLAVPAPFGFCASHLLGPVAYLLGVPNAFVAGCRPLVCHLLVL